MHVCECVTLFYNPAAASITQSGSYSVAGEEKRKLGDRLRHKLIHYSSAVRGRQRITVLTHEELPPEPTAHNHYIRIEMYFLYDAKVCK